MKAQSQRNRSIVKIWKKKRASFCPERTRPRFLLAWITISLGFAGTGDDDSCAFWQVKKVGDSSGFEPRVSCCLGKCLNHWTTKPLWISQLFSLAEANPPIHSLSPNDHQKTMETEAYTGKGSNCRNSMDPPNPTVDMHVPYDNDSCAFWQVKKVGDSPGFKPSVFFFRYQRKIPSHWWTP